jgi:uncharacterized protein (TIRG00374 family)
MVNRDKIAVFTRIVISIILIVLLFKMIEPRAFWSALSKTNVIYLLIAFTWIFLDRVLMTYRFLLLLDPLKIRVPFWIVVKIFFISNFVGNFLPSNMASDVLRAYMFKRFGALTKIVSAFVVDRVIGSISKLALILIALVLGSLFETEINALIRKALPWSILFLLVCLTGLIIILKRSWMKRFGILLGYKAGNHLFEKVGAFYDSCHAFKSYPGPVSKAFGISFINHIGSILKVYIVARALGIEVSLFYFFILLPIVHLLAMLPISINGLGIEEGGYVVIFTQLGVPLQEALALSLLLRALMILSTLPGAVYYMLEGFPSRNTVKSDLSLPSQ